MSMLTFRQHLRLLPQVGGRFTQIVRVAEVDRYFVPEVFPHINNDFTDIPDARFQLRYFITDFRCHFRYPCLFFLPILFADSHLFIP